MKNAQDSLAGEAYVILRERILHGELPIGKVISRRKLASELGMIDNLVELLEGIEWRNLAPANLLDAAVRRLRALLSPGLLDKLPPSAQVYAAAARIYRVLGRALPPASPLATARTRSHTPSWRQRQPTGSEQSTSFEDPPHVVKTVDDDTTSGCSQDRSRAIPPVEGPARLL